MVRITFAAIAYAMARLAVDSLPRRFNQHEAERLFDELSRAEHELVLACGVK